MRSLIPSPEPPPEDGSTALAHVQAIKRWTAEILKLPETAVITVHEQPCADPGCPLWVTHILVQTETRRSWRFERPKFAVTKLMLTQVLLAP